MKDHQCVFSDSCIDFQMNNCDSCSGDNRCGNCIHLIKRDDKNMIGFCDLRNDDRNYEDFCRFFA